MSKHGKWLVPVLGAVIAATIVACSASRQSPAITTSTPAPTAAAPSATTTATPGLTPTVAPSSGPAAPSASPATTPSPSATVDDPTRNWDAPYDCDEFPGFSHLAVCRVKGKTAVQVLESCRAAGRYFVWAQSNGRAGSAKDELSYEQYQQYSAVCLRGVGMKVTDLSGLGACPEGCKAPDAQGLQYILLTGEVGGELVPAFFDAKTGEVVDNSKEYQKIQTWIRQFEAG